ncbi:hypothetical protein BH10PAT1_BH10PAT1_7140 [soil metagenome]
MGKARGLKKDSVNDRFKLSSYISSVDSVVKSGTEETLGSVLSLVASSHIPVFIFTKEDEFFGLISPYQALYSGKHQYTAHVSSLVVKPQYITLKTPLYDVASYMLESRIYVLPLFSEDRKLTGTIHIKQVIKGILKDKDLLKYIASTIKSHAPITAKSDSSVGDIYAKMQEKEVSRVILVNNNGNLDGIVSRNGLLKAFTKPTEKQRFGKNGSQPTNRAFDEEKKYRKNSPVKNYATDMVNSLPSGTSQEEIINKLLSTQHNSVVLTDKNNKPVGFLSMHDILVGLASLRPEPTVNLIISRPSTNVTEGDFTKAKELLSKFGQKMNKRIAIDKIEVHFEEPKFPTGGTSIYNTTIIITPIAGTKIISKTKNKNFLESIYSAIAQIEKEQRRSGITRSESKHTQK